MVDIITASVKRNWVDSGSGAPELVSFTITGRSVDNTSPVYSQQTNILTAITTALAGSPDGSAVPSLPSTIAAIEAQIDSALGVTGSRATIEGDYGQDNRGATSQSSGSDSLLFEVVPFALTAGGSALGGANSSHVSITAVPVGATVTSMTYNCQAAAGNVAIIIYDISYNFRAQTNLVPAVLGNQTIPMAVPFTFANDTYRIGLFASDAGFQAMRANPGSSSDRGIFSASGTPNVDPLPGPVSSVNRFWVIGR